MIQNDLYFFRLLNEFLMRNAEMLDKKTSAPIHIHYFLRNIFREKDWYLCTGML
jgi:hypothetical protein